jgi:hypothetical protein
LIVNDAGGLNRYGRLVLTGLFRERERAHLGKSRKN